MYPVRKYSSLVLFASTNEQFTKVSWSGVDDGCSEPLMRSYIDQRPHHEDQQQRHWLLTHCRRPCRDRQVQHPTKPWPQYQLKPAKQYRKREKEQELWHRKAVNKSNYYNKLEEISLKIKIDKKLTVCGRKSIFALSSYRQRRNEQKKSVRAGNEPR